MTTVEVVSDVSDALVDAFAALIPQLSSSNPPPTASELQAMIDAPGTTVFVAKSEQKIVGTLTLITFRAPTGVRAWIEDVVVDGNAQGHGVGGALTRAAIDEARSRGANTVDLTSRPTREAANRLYQREGFEARQTNVYRFQIER
jgi:ribosomal protein S18 acetylase RimI-like enzyme